MGLLVPRLSSALNKRGPIEAFEPRTKNHVLHANPARPIEATNHELRTTNHELRSSALIQRGVIEALWCVDSAPCWNCTTSAVAAIRAKCHLMPGTARFLMRSIATTLSRQASRIDPSRRIHGPDIEHRMYLSMIAPDLAGGLLEPDDCSMDLCGIHNCQFCRKIAKVVLTGANDSE